VKLNRTDILAVPHHQVIGFENLKGFKATGVSIDSRSIKNGDIFIAIRGEQFDGHNFVSNAVEAGAAALIIERRWAEANSAMMVSMYIPRLVVEDTLQALGSLANIHRRKFDIPVIAIGGSNGKTTTKEMIRSVLNKKFSLLCTEGNLNNHIGVPQTLFRLEKKHKVAVVEVGMNHPGEINYLCSILEPTHGLITNIGREHLEFLGSVEDVAKAEGELFDWLRIHRGICFVNADDIYINRMSKKLRRASSYGLKARSAATKGAIIDWNHDAHAELRIKPRGKKAFSCLTGVPGEHNAMNALAAAAVGLAFKVAPVDIQKALSSFQSTNKRMQIVHTHGITIVNDTYNANPDSTLAALSTLHAMKSKGKKFAILSDMLELGSQSEALHHQVGKAMSQFGIHGLWTTGSLAKYIHDAALVETKAHFETKAQLIEYALNTILAGDIILVKGSRGMKMEDVVAALSEQVPQKTGI
jgi:UDP-N-acetylmuramoyl-tripeptide--D-alanyl-D-alanine ligase